MLNTGMNPVNKGDILHRLILGKNKLGEVIKDWNCFCRQFGSVIETFQHIFEYEEVKKYYSDLSTHLGIQRITGLRTLIGDQYLWNIGKERPKILAQFAISSFIIAEICVGRLTGDKLNWRRTKFKIVAYLSHLLKSNNIRLTLLGDNIPKLITV